MKFCLEANNCLLKILFIPHDTAVLIFVQNECLNLLIFLNNSFCSIYCSCLRSPSSIKSRMLPSFFVQKAPYVIITWRTRQGKRKFLLLPLAKLAEISLAQVPYLPSAKKRKFVFSQIQQEYRLQYRYINHHFSTSKNMKIFLHKLN